MWPHGDAGDWSNHRPLPWSIVAYSCITKRFFKRWINAVPSLFNKGVVRQSGFFHGSVFYGTHGGTGQYSPALPALPLLRQFQEERKGLERPEWPRTNQSRHDLYGMSEFIRQTKLQKHVLGVQTKWLSETTIMRMFWRHSPSWWRHDWPIHIPASPL